MDIASFIRASTAIPQAHVQTAAAVKMIKNEMETQTAGVELLLQGLDEAMQSRPPATGDLGQYIDIST